jgi:hypothetical protein
MLVLAGVLGFVLALPRMERPSSNLRLAAEAFAFGVLTCLGFAAAWAAY